MKPSPNPIKIKFVTKIKHERITNMFTGRETMMPVRTGEVHIFELIDNEHVKELKTWAFCGITRSEVEEETKDEDKRPENLPVCKECENGWKNDKRSPWKSWSKAATSLPSSRAYLAVIMAPLFHGACIIKMIADKPAIIRFLLG